MAKILRHALVPMALLACAPAIVPYAHADEGMWTMDNLPVKQMQDRYHFTPSKSGLIVSPRRLPGWRLAVPLLLSRQMGW